VTPVPPARFVVGPNLIHRSVLAERLIDFETEPGAEFVVEMFPGGYSLNENWVSLPKSAQSSDNGVILISVVDSLAGIRPRLALLPPFPISDSSESNSFDTVRQHMVNHHAIAIILLRLGNWAIAIAEDGELVITKTGSRYVKNQHKKGGQSSNRFRRGEVASARFRDYTGHLEYLVMGGDRVVLGQFLKRIKLPNGLGDRALPNRISVDQPGRKSLDNAVKDAWSYRMYEFVD
jgi:hypothetical protein